MHNNAKNRAQWQINIILSIQSLLWFTVCRKFVKLKQVVVYYIYKSIVRTNDATRKKHLRLVHYQPQRQILGDVSIMQMKMRILLVANGNTFCNDIISTFPICRTNYSNIYSILKNVIN
mgnify:CR=1 FL=1